MAQSGYTPILIYGSGTASNVPSAANLTSSANGVELALNYNDGKIFYKSSAGTVTLLADQNAVTVATANGFGGTIAKATATTTPAITIRTTISGVLKGNGTAISAAVSGTDYAPATSGTSILYGNGSGGFSNVAVGSGLSFAGGTLSASGGSSTLTISNKTGAYTVVSGDAGTVINCTSSGFTISLTAAATLGSGFNCQIWNSASSGNITIDPNGAEPIPFNTTYVLGPGQMATIVCTGSKFNVIAGTISNYVNSVAIGQQATVNNNNSAAVGYQASAYGGNSAAFGSGANAATDYALAVGYGVQAYSARSSAIGQNSSSAGSVAGGSGAMSLGGSYASGTDSFAAAIADNTSSYGAKGTNSIAIGKYATAATTGGVAISSTYAGGGASANTAGSIAIGDNAISAGSRSITLGSVEFIYGPQTGVSGSGAVAIGNGALARQIGKYAFSSGDLSGGDFVQNIQYGLIVLNAKTTSVFAQPLQSDGGNNPASSSNQLCLPDNSAFTFFGLVVARRASSGGTESAAWRFEGLIRRGSGAGTTVLVASTVTTISNAPGWGLSLSADTTNGCLAVNATGAVYPVRWTATVETSEVVFA